MRLYVGNIPFHATEEEIRAKFGELGEVNEVKIVTDRETGRSRGFAFVDMDDAGAIKAIDELADEDFGGRPMVVNQAHDRKPPQGRNGHGRDRERRNERC